MTRTTLPRRALGSLFAGAAATALARPALAQGRTKIRLLTSWYAQAEHGGYYQARATGLYERAGLDVEIKMGGPQVNGVQLMLGGEADLIMNYPLQALKNLEQNLPTITIGTSFQFDLAGIMTHDDVTSLAGLKNHRILIANSSRTTWWPWMKKRFGYTDAQAGPYTFNLQPFLVDRQTAVQSYLSSEPYEAEKQGAKVRFHLLAADGFPPYGSTLMTTRPFLSANAGALRAFMQASAEGWKEFVAGNPAPASAGIIQDNPRMTQDRIDYAIAKLREVRALDGDEAATNGLCTMTEARWQRTRDFMVEAELLRANVDWKRAFTLDVMRDVKVLMA